MTADPNQLRVGLVAPRDLVRVSALEDLPIDSLWTGGHVASANPSPEALMALARLSAVTRRVQIGTSILLLPLYSPAIVAKQVADLDRATGARVILGVGVGGEYPQEFRACGVPIGERGRRADEAIPLLKRLWSAEQISHDGRFYPMVDVRFAHARIKRVAPRSSSPAGRSRRCAGPRCSVTDGCPTFISLRRYASSAARIREIADEAGRDLRSFEWYAFTFVHIDRDGRRARQEAARMMGGKYDQDFGTMVDHVAAVGTPEEVLDKIEHFVAAGARHLISLPAKTRPDDFDTIIGHLFEDVLPRLDPGVRMGSGREARRRVIEREYRSLEMLDWVLPAPEGGHVGQFALGGAAVPAIGVV